MKLDLFLVPRSKNAPSKRVIARKLISTLLTTVSLTGATFLFNNVRRASLMPPAIVRSESEESAPVGLSRRRPAFNKAIGILADAAPTDPDLADYYTGVARRVKGRHAKGSDHSGVYVVKADRKIDMPAIDTMSLEKSPLRTALDGVVSLAKNLAIPGTVEAPTEPSVASTPVAQSEDLPASPNGFTVGDIGFETNPAIEHWMKYYSATPIGRSTMTIGIGRSNSYLEMARAEFRNAGVPEDLVWLAFVESVWNPRAVSPAAAGGIWQFIPATATDYGLRVQSGNDERADPLKQTRVAAIYLHDLYTIFGDWALAMAAYNSGEPRVMGAIVKNGRADFWDLYNKQLLPKETRDYVPKILAAIRIASQADEYGLIASKPETGDSAGS